MTTSTIQTFAITAMGRSGTEFLAKAMNRSTTWTVAHEPRPSHNGVAAIKVQPRFKKRLYGEVNSFLRFCLDDLNVDRKGLIIRDPYEIVLSTANRGGIDSAKLRHIIEGLAVVESFVDAGHRLIRFERMTEDRDYLATIFLDFGITDIESATIDLSRKVNASPGHRTWPDLPLTIRQDATLHLHPFRTRFYPDRSAP